MPGQQYEDCVVPPASPDGTQPLYCYSGGVWQGSASDWFGPVTVSTDGTANFESWYDTKNDDGAIGSNVSCDAHEIEPHHIAGIRFDEANWTVVLDVALRHPESIKRACERLHTREFNADETYIRSHMPIGQDRGLILSDEEDFVKMVVRFKPPDRQPRLEVTAEPLK